MTVEKERESNTVGFTSLYELNKQGFQYVPAISKEKTTEKLKEIGKWFKDKKYCMLLCRERYDYTVFNFIKKGYTPKGIYFSVRYQYEVNHGDPKKSEGGIGIVPHIYQNCSAYWQKRENEFKDICSRIEKQMQEIKEKKVKEVAYVQRDRKKKKLLSLSDIMEGEE